MLLSRRLRRLIRVGQLTVIDAAGHRHRFSGARGPHVTIRLHEPRLHWKLAVRPDLYTGEAYMDGTLTIEDADLFDFLDLIGRNIEIIGKEPITGVLSWLDRQTRWFQQHNPAGRARRNAAHHYNLSGDLYDAFLDADRQYSCAYFASDGDTLETAQRRKKRHIAAKLLLQPGMSVLDVGCGWGGLGLYLAKVTGARVTGITLAEEQLRFARERATREGFDDRVDFALSDYREVRGQFDRIVSVGMFEHVGAAHFDEFFLCLCDRLADDGVALVHTIGRAEPPGATNAWLRKYIFPGGYAPALSEVVAAIERAGLWVTDVEVWRLHYAETLRHWRRRFLAHCGGLPPDLDDRFRRMWDFYLASCEMSFRYLRTVVFQIQLAKSQHAVPLIRDYMVDDERRMPLAASTMSNRAA